MIRLRFLPLQPSTGHVGDRVDWIIPVGVVLAFVLVAAQTVTQLVDFGFFDLRIAAVDSNRHSSVFGALSLLANGAAAFTAALSGAWHRSRAWAVGAVLIAAVLALRISDIGSGGAVRFVVLLPLVAGLLLVIWRIAIDAPARVRAVIRVGLWLLVFSYAVHIVGPTVVTELGYTHDSWAYQIKGVLKHGCELGGWTLLATAFRGTAPEAASDRPSFAPLQG